MSALREGKEDDIMLNQLIYTRCSPQRELENKGQVVRADGFGVFSMSQELATNPPVASYDFLQKCLVKQNAAKENLSIGLFNSYEYIALDDCTYAYVYEVARPHCKEPRKNGMGHRTGTYIKQCLVGAPKGYPFQWFGASVWNAHLRSENDYYLDSDPTAAPAWLPQVPDQLGDSNMNLDRIRNFVRDGRKEAVKAAIWFLIQEYAKPEDERKVLLIKDTSENMELWIAAIELAFSADMARTIPFSTNKYKLANQIDSILFYYTDENGRVSTMRNNSAAQRRHPYHMIVGYHPKDTFSAVKQMPNSNFVIIDGTTKNIGISTDETIRSAYYEAVVSYGVDGMDFVREVLPGLGINSINDKIPVIYDAYKYILDSEHKADTWNYSPALKHLSCLLQFGMPKNEALSQYILDEGMQAYERFAAEDERNNFQFLKILWDISRTIQRSKEVTGCMADRLSQKMSNLRITGSKLTETWNAIKAGRVQTIVYPALCQLFNDSELSIYSGQFEFAPASATATILDMYYSTLKMEKNGIASIIEDEVRKQFVCRGLIAALKEPTALRTALQGIAESEDVLNGIALAVSQYLDQYHPERTEQWWDSIIDLRGGDVLSMCQTLCRSPKADSDMIEHLLANGIMRERKCGREHYRLFEDTVKRFGANKKTGIVFFGACLKVEDPYRLEGLIHSIRESRLYLAAEKELFQLVDKRLPYDATSGSISMTFREMKNWADKLGETSMSLSLHELGKTLKRERKGEKVLPVMYDFVKLSVPMPKNLFQRKYFSDLALSASDFFDAEIHMVFLHLFVCQDRRTKQDYVKAYVDAVLSFSKGKDLACSMISLCEAMCGEWRIPARNMEEVKETEDMLNRYFTRVLPDYYKSNLADQVAKMDASPKVKKMLLSKLAEAEKKVPKSNLGSILGGLFGRK